jgi:DNA replicative helicase MCM subunit Mcm2 (Cdc46/Mcm family)
LHPAVEQQFQFTEPQICKNPQCKPAGDFQIVPEKCAFVDWQRLRVQENADEIPAGIFIVRHRLTIVCFFSLSQVTAF